MVGQNVVIVSCVLLGTFFSGCIAEDTGTPKRLGGDLAFDADTGAVSGIILSEEELPIQEALVQLVGQADEPIASATASPEGLFALPFIPPGTYTLIAQAPRYVTAAKTVDVLEGTVVSDIVFKLAAGASDVPYHTITVFPISVSGVAGHVKSPMPLPPLTQPGDTGGCMYGPPPLDPATVKTCQGTRLTCDGICEVHYGHCNTPEGEWGDDWSNYGCDFAHGWMTVVSELESTPQTTTTGKGWAFTTWLPNVTRSGCEEDPPNCDRGSVFFDDPRSFRNTQEAPIYRWIDKAVMDERGVAEEDRCCDLGWRIFPAPCGVNGCDTLVNADVMQDQRATIYFSYFMLNPAPEGWSALGEA